MELRDLITNYNDVKGNINKKLEVATTVEEVNAISNEFKNMKAQLKKQAEKENVEISFDIDGYAEFKDCALRPMTDSEQEDFFKNKTIIHDGGNEVVNNSKLKILNQANITKVYKNEKGLDLGNYVKGALTGNWMNAEKEMNEFKALSTGTGTVLIPKSLSAQILEKVMNKSLIYKSGVPVIDMPNGNITIAKVTNNPTFGFKEELAPVTPQDATFEGVQLQGRMVYGLMKVSLEVLHSAQNLTEILLQAMSDAITDSVDKAMLYGSGTNDIKGIFNYDSINKVEASGIRYDSFVKAVGAIRANNGEPSIMGINATTDTALNLLVDTTGQPLNTPKVVEDLNRVVSNNLRNNLGTATDESEGIVYDPNALVIGNQVQFMFETSREKGFEDGSVYLRVYSLLDMALVRPEYITRISKLK